MRLARSGDCFLLAQGTRRVGASSSGRVTRAATLRPVRPRCRATLSARESTRVKGQGLVFEEPKADRSRRTVALPKRLVESLQRHHAAQAQERLAAGSLWQDHELVFCQVKGGPIDRHADWKARKVLLQVAGVRDVRLHDGRHTAATLLLTAGVDPRVAMRGLGHSQMRTTTDTYPRWQPRWHQERRWPLPQRGNGHVVTGGAEGTRTPDPHTARAAGRCSAPFLSVPLAHLHRRKYSPGPRRTSRDTPLGNHRGTGSARPIDLVQRAGGEHELADVVRPAVR